MAKVANYKFFYALGYSVLLIKTSKIHTFTTFHSESVGMLIIYLHTRFHILSSSGSLVTDVKLKANETFSHSHHVLVMHSTQKLA
jgi:hypothetical protein